MEKIKLNKMISLMFFNHSLVNDKRGFVPLTKCETSL